MSHRIFRHVAALISGFAAFALPAQTVADSLRMKLAETTDPADSITILYNIYDSSPFALQGGVLRELYHTADRLGDDHTLGDVLKLAGNYFTNNDSMMHVLLDRVDRLPDSDDKESTRLFLKVRATAQQVRKLPEDERQAKMRECFAQYINSPKMNPYQRTEYLFYLCAFLRSATEGDLLTRYLQELQDLIDKLPSRDIALKSLFYTQASICYITNEMYDKAIESDKALLDIMRELEKQYTAKGRIYRNYSRSAYISYRRILRCHQSLTDEEVDHYYNKLLQLIDSDPSVRHDFDNRQRPTIYYLMAKKRYDEVMPIIKKQIEDPKNTRDEMIYLSEALATAARATGDNKSLLQALTINNDLLKKRIQAKAAESYKELQIVYEMNNLRQANSTLALANQQIVTDRHKEQLLYAVIGLIALVIAVVIIYLSYRRERHLSHSLIRSNAIVRGERDALRKAQEQLIEARDKAKAADRIKTDFVNNMSHEIRTPLAAIVEYSGLIADCADDDKRGYIKRFAEVISLNTDLLLTLVNDVLDLPSLENSKLTVHPALTSVQKMCRLTVDNVRKHLSPEVKLIFENDSEPDIRIVTDAHRVEQVLLNLLLNAAKFTPKGTISLRYDLTDGGDRIAFTVTDTGIGIPKGREDAIFERFEKVDSSTQGNGLGLYIGRLLAELLRGELNIDKDYRAGARFIFTVPAK